MSLIDVRRRFIEALAGPLGRPLEADPVSALDAYSQFAMIAWFNINCQFLISLFLGLLQKGNFSLYIWSFHISGNICHSLHISNTHFTAPCIYSFLDSISI